LRVVVGRLGKPGKGPVWPRTAVVGSGTVTDGVGAPLVSWESGGMSDAVAVKVAAGRMLFVPVAIPGMPEPDWPAGTETPATDEIADEAAEGAAGGAEDAAGGAAGDAAEDAAEATEVVA